MYRVNTIYPAFMGEQNCFGIGQRCVFVRFSGCNIRCYESTLGVTCDTPEALCGTCGTDMTTKEIIERLREYNIRTICLTGGEPLLQKPIELLSALSKNGFAVVVETNGTLSIEPYRHVENISFVMDYKAPSAGVKSFCHENFYYLRKRDYIKFVLYDDADYEDMKIICERMKGKVNLVAGLFWGAKIGYVELANRILRDRLPLNLNMQVHKMMVLYDEYPEAVRTLVVPKEL